MKSEVIGQRIAQILKERNYSQTKLAKEYGLNQSVISEMIRGFREIDRLVNIVSTKFNISRDYIIDGELSKMGINAVEEVFSPTGDNKMDEIRDSVSLMSYKAPNKNIGIPLIPTSAMAGALGGDSITINEWDIEDYYVIPAFKKSDFCIRVDGDSMQPRYMRGDILACTRVPLSNLWFQWGKVYIIDTRQGVLVKHVEKGNDSNHIKLVSDNTDYKPFEIPISELFGLAIVNGVIRVE